MQNSLAIRVADFLKKFPPFHILKEKELLEISATVTVLYFEKGETVFTLGDVPKPHFFVVQEGAIGLYTNAEEGRLLINICDEGELFGLRPLVEKDAYRMHAIAEEETILYAISVEAIDKFMESNSSLAQFIYTSFRINLDSSDRELFNSGTQANFADGYFDHQLVSFSKNPIVATSGVSIQEGAKTMAHHRVGSLIIVEHNRPIGIITDKDLRLKVATGLVAIDNPIKVIMSSPVITVASNLTVAEAQIIMLEHKITHLCVTEDGTPDSAVKGVISEHDILALRSNNPYSLLKEIKRAISIDQLKTCRERLTKLIETYVAQDAAMNFVTQIVGALNNALTHRIIELCLTTMPTEPPTTFSWMALGSQGRKEQLLLTDQDNALVFDDVDPDKLEETKNYFLMLAEKVNEGLNVVGYWFCPADMMAKNPNWCLSLSQWKSQFEHWIKQPTEDSMMLCTIFFDYKSVYGNAELTRKLTEHIFESVGSFEIFMNYLARNAIQNPAPIGFFRQFLVETDKEHKNEFDLKARAMMPLVDAARVLSISHNLGGVNSTLERYRALAVKEPQNRILYEACEEAFKILLRFRVEQGIKDKDSGRYIELESLSKMERLQLRSCFKPLKDIQELLRIRFQLSQIT